MRTCLFAGPTLYRVATPSSISRFGPAVLGSVYRAVEAGYTRIGLVDGHFGNVPAVWHKEILFALAQGADVAGAASMGALRAAELAPFGMVGIGRIFRLFRSGRWTDDDELAVIHADAELAYCPVSDAMANIRYTLRRLARAGEIDATLARELARAMKQRHFSRRTREEFAHVATALLGRRGGERLMRAYARHYVDVKRADALALVAHLERPRAPRRRRMWTFPRTGHWRWQFGNELADIPPLVA